MMKRLLVILLATLSLAACVQSIDGYTSDPTTVAALSAYSGNKISVGDFSDFPGEGIITQCRGYGVITTPNHESLAQYIRNAFISELERANAYSPDSPYVISGRINQLTLNTISFGEWIIKITLTSNNGRSISARENYRFQSNVVGINTCQLAGDTLSAAIRNVIRQLVTAPDFRLLTEHSNYPKAKPRHQQTGTQPDSGYTPVTEAAPQSVTQQETTPLPRAK
ncbi:MAG: conjugal transfer protein TraG N-terminal domain-containing protein [Burkholderiaceae bacterium]|jgi:hypothetical protein|nr:conjugal transfer protein TraG N-terminal domain-containing protein [Burkholderiaceae bacterium]